MIFAYEAVASTCTDKVDMKLVGFDDSDREVFVDERTEYHAPYSLYGNEGRNFVGKSFEDRRQAFHHYNISAWPNGDTNKFFPTSFLNTASMDRPSNCVHLCG